VCAKSDTASCHVLAVSRDLPWTQVRSGDEPCPAPADATGRSLVLNSAMIERAIVTAPEMIGLLVWWIVVLAAPVILVRRRSRRRAADRLRRQVGRPAAEQPAGRQCQPPSAAATSETRASPVSRLAVPRLSSQALEPLCRFVDFQRRLELAASELRARLSQLPAARWRIEPYPLTGERRNTFVVMGRRAYSSSAPPTHPGTGTT
jgi:hypothetical protein